MKSWNERDCKWKERIHWMGWKLRMISKYVHYACTHELNQTDWRKLFEIIKLCERKKQKSLHAFNNPNKILYKRIQRRYEPLWYSIDEMRAMKSELWHFGWRVDARTYVRLDYQFAIAFGHMHTYFPY